MQNNKKNYAPRSDWGKTRNNYPSFSRLADSIHFMLWAYETATWLFQHTLYRVLDKLNKEINKHEYKNHSSERLEHKLSWIFAHFPHFKAGLSTHEYKPTHQLNSHKIIHQHSTENIHHIHPAHGYIKIMHIKRIWTYVSLSLSLSATPAPHPALTGALDAAFLRHAATTTLCVGSSWQRSTTAPQPARGHSL